MFTYIRRHSAVFTVCCVLAIGAVCAVVTLNQTNVGEGIRRPLKELKDGVFYISPDDYAGTVGHLTRKKVVFLPAPQQTLSLSKPAVTAADYLGPESCRECHAAYVDTSAETAHYRTCRLPSETSLPDDFGEGRNILRTATPDMLFEMSRSGDKYYQSVVVQRRGVEFEHKEEISLVTGSAKYGQTFLYWKDQCLYELPVSHFTELGEWVNSPGYVDGVANFARPIFARCLECHSTWIEQSGVPLNRFREQPSILGITCEKCHGPGREHVEYHRRVPDDRTARHVVNPGNLSRERSIDMCSLCHSGAGEPLQDPFSFRPGDKLADFVKIPPDSESGPGGVHSANQQARMALSKCFQQSPDMQCTTCHNPHHQERGNAKLFIERCFKCHESGDCRIVRETGAAAEARCIDCHMPSRADSQMPMQKENETFRPMLRDHLIDIWDDKTSEVLKEIASSGSKP
jgi:hypothetical protein